jgi:hypothetical protein
MDTIIVRASHVDKNHSLAPFFLPLFADCPNVAQLRNGIPTKLLADLFLSPSLSQYTEL